VELALLYPFGAQNFGDGYYIFGNFFTTLMHVQGGSNMTGTIYV
jgi:hypothetical protein